MILQVPSLPSNARRSKALPLLDTLCVPIVGGTPEQMRQASLAALATSRFQEFRLDYLDDPGAAIPTLGTHLRAHPELTALATARTLASGGRFEGTAQDELALLRGAAAAGFRLVDLSLESAEALGAPALQQLREDGAVILVSFHDFTRTGELTAVLDQMKWLGPDLGKIVSTAEKLTDNLATQKLLRHTAGDAPFPLVAMAMGEYGAPSRILGPSWGSAFTFAAATEAEATAPGQFTASALSDLFRIHRITPATHIYGVAGDPIHSSLSPRMLNTAFASAKLDAVYLPLRTSDAVELVQLARELPLAGFSVTMPLKQAVLLLLDHVDPLAAKVGAVNTVRRTAAGAFEGFNSDLAGITGPLEARRTLQGASVLVLGAGGAARAAVLGCMEAGARVYITNRTLERAGQLARELGGEAIDRSGMRSRHFDVLINATPAGMHGNPHRLPIEPNELNAGLVFDLVYNPLETPLLALARERGIATIPGVEMFVHQGARQFELWTGLPAPRDVMERSVREALARVARP